MSPPSRRTVARGKTVNVIDWVLLAEHARRIQLAPPTSEELPPATAVKAPRSGSSAMDRQTRHEIRILTVGTFIAVPLIASIAFAKS